jgi:hypothetical protein
MISKLSRPASFYGAPLAARPVRSAPPPPPPDPIGLREALKQLLPPGTKLPPAAASAIYPGGVRMKIPARPGVTEDRGYFDLSPLGDRLTLTRATGHAREVEVCSPDELRRAEEALRAMAKRGVKEGRVFTEGRSISQDGLYWDAAAYNAYGLYDGKMKLEGTYVHHGWGFSDDTMSLHDVLLNVQFVAMNDKIYVFDVNGQRVGGTVPYTRELLAEGRVHAPGTAVGIPSIAPAS